MTNRQKIELKISEVRQRLNEIAGLDEMTDANPQRSGLASNRVRRSRSAPPRRYHERIRRRSPNARRISG